MIDIGISLALLLVVIFLLREVDGIHKTVNKPKRGRGRPRKVVDVEVSRPGGMFKQERIMIDIEPNYDEMMKLYDRLETAKEKMGDRYLLHPDNFIQNRNKANDDARDINLLVHRGRGDTPLVHIDDLEWW